MTSVNIRAEPPDLSQRELFTLADLRTLGIEFHRVHLSRLAQQGKFPQPVRLSENRIAWVASEVRAWVAERAASRERA